MKAKISTKTGYVRQDGWRGYSRPVFAVAGANDTGTFSDSPCPTGVRKKEVRGFTKLLKEAGIPYLLKWCQSSNIFCMMQFVVVAEADHAKAYEMAEEYQKGKDLFYACDVLSTIA